MICIHVRKFPVLIPEQLDLGTLKKHSLILIEYRGVLRLLDQDFRENTISILEDYQNLPSAKITPPPIKVHDDHLMPFTQKFL